MGEQREPSDEKSCNIEDTPSLSGVLAQFRSHQFNAIGLYAGGAKTCSYRSRVAGLFFPTQSTIGIAAVQTAIEYEYDEIRCETRPFL